MSIWSLFSYWEVMEYTTLGAGDGAISRHTLSRPLCCLIFHVLLLPMWPSLPAPSFPLTVTFVYTARAGIFKEKDTTRVFSSSFLQNHAHYWLFHLEAINMSTIIPWHFFSSKAAHVLRCLLRSHSFPRCSHSNPFPCHRWLRPSRSQVRHFRKRHLEVHLHHNWEGDQTCHQDISLAHLLLLFMGLGSQDYEWLGTAQESLNCTTGHIWDSAKPFTPQMHDCGCNKTGLISW